MDRTRRSFLIGSALAASAGCLATGPEYDVEHSLTAWTGYAPDWTAPRDAPTTDVTTEVLVENLEIPWDLSFAPDGTLYLTERVGRIRRFDGDGLATVAEPDAVIDAGSVPAEPDDDPNWEAWWVPGGEGGLLGVAVHPAHPAAPYVYAYYTTRVDGRRVNRVVRFDVTADDPATTTEVVVDDIPANAHHNGGRIRFGPENYLWITTGDAGEKRRAQDGDFLGGKVLRVTPTGEPAPGNPDIYEWDDRIYTVGHRNPQGIAWLPDGTPLATEHGPNARDELNVLQTGANYGWPTARAPGSYAGTSFGRPLLSTDPNAPSWAPTGATFYTGDAIPSWTNRLVFGELMGQHVAVATLTPAGTPLPPVRGGVRFDADWLNGDWTVTAHRLLPELGRVRHVAQAPNGDLYAVTSNRDGRAHGTAFPRPRDDILVRIHPAD